MTNHISNEVLAHYGVLGMKWGVRKDGKPQGYQGPNKSGKTKTVKVSSDYTKTKTNRGVDPRSLSNAQLREVTERLMLESNYTQQLSRSREASVGKKKASKLQTTYANLLTNKAALVSVNLGAAVLVFGVTKAMSLLAEAYPDSANLDKAANVMEFILNNAKSKKKK